MVICRQTKNEYESAVETAVETAVESAVETIDEFIIFLMKEWNGGFFREDWVGGVKSNRKDHII